MVCALLVFDLCVFSVRCVHGVVQSGHVQVAAGRPVVGGDVADARGDEHQGRSCRRGTRPRRGFCGGSLG